MNLKNSIMQDIRTRFAAEGIAIPYPTRTLQFWDAEQGADVAGAGKKFRRAGAAAKPKRARRGSR